MDISVLKNRLGLKYKTAVLFLLVVISAQAQTDSSDSGPRIEDNSFLLEEAYNQETGVVQFIQNISFGKINTPDWSYGFTNEIPMYGSKHQFSYSINYQYSPLAKGMGDAMINYRYELTGKSKWATTAPRLSLILPTGDKSLGMGLGAWGGQFNFPASKVISKFLIMHVNAGYTFFNAVKRTDAKDSSATISKSITGVNAGLSTIWVLRKNIHFLCEFILNSEDDFDGYGKKISTTETIINPGFRFAFDMGKSQIVPGLSFPTTFSNGKSTTGAFIYLSIEPNFNQ